MKRCKTCEIVSEVMGKRLFERWFFRNKKIARQEIEPLTHDLSVQIVGGLVDRGWTIHDIDVVGTHKDVIVFVKRLKCQGITNPVHYCGPSTHHSHVKCLWNGIKLLFGKDGF